MSQWSSEAKGSQRGLVAVVAVAGSRAARGSVCECVSVVTRDSPARVGRGAHCTELYCTRMRLEYSQITREAGAEKQVMALWKVMFVHWNGMYTEPCGTVLVHFPLLLVSSEGSFC